MNVVTVAIPEYHVDAEPDHATIARQVDSAIRDHFKGRTVVARGISIDAHPGRTVDDLVKIILTTGTDRYDPERVGDRYANIEGKMIDIFGLRRKVTPRMRLFAALSWGFYHGGIEIHGQPIRLDVLTIYDASELRAVLHQYQGRPDRKRDGFRFAHPDRKDQAVLGVIQLDR